MPKPSSQESVAGSIRDEVLTLIDNVDRTYFTLGQKLREIATAGLFVGWGFKTFEEYVEAELGFARRKAYYLMSIAEKAEQIGVDPEDLATIGWTKAKEILLYVEDLPGFKKWAKRATTLSVSALADALRAEVLGTAVPKKGRDADGNPTTELDGETFHEIRVLLADDQYKNVKLALDHAANVAKSDKVGHLLDMICLDYLANNVEISDLGEKLAAWANKGLVELTAEGE